MWQITDNRNIIFSWLLWHYAVSLKELILRWRDILFFISNYFSIPFLLRTLFSPWKRYKVFYGKGFDFNKLLDAFVFNTFSRIMGAIVRLFVIIIGVLTYLFIVIIGAVIVIIWILLPLIVVGGISILLKWLILN